MSKPAVNAPQTVHQRVSDAWTIIESRDSRLYQAYMYLAALLALGLVANMKLNFLKLDFELLQIGRASCRERV